MSDVEPEVVGDCIGDAPNDRDAEIVIDDDLVTDSVMDPDALSDMEPDAEADTVGKADDDTPAE